MTSDDLWPRTAEFRYRIYAQRDGDLHVLAAAASPQGAGLALATLHAEGGFPTSGRIGLMDIRPGQKTGTWIVSPFAKAVA